MIYYRLLKDDLVHGYLVLDVKEVDDSTNETILKNYFYQNSYQEINKGKIPRIVLMNDYKKKEIKDLDSFYKSFEKIDNLDYIYISIIVLKKVY